MRLLVNGTELSGSVRAIASKSVAHRLLICAALSDSVCQIRCESLSRDISATVDCLRALGAEINYENGVFSVYPISGEIGTFTAHAGESGSTLRFLLPVACAFGAKGEFIMEGRLPSRPLSPLYEALCEHGCSLSPQGKSPMEVSGKLSGGRFRLRADVSSQFISGLLFALPMCCGDSRIELEGHVESASYIEMTLDALRLFGIKVEKTEKGYFIPGSQKYISPGKLNVEGDWSNGAFWLCAAALGRPIKVTGLESGSLQGDKAVLSVLETFGNPLRGFDVDAKDIPDLVPVLSVVASVAEGRSVFYGAARLRLKESDRLESTAEMLKALGASVKVNTDGLEITGAALHSGTVDACNDHRIAMSAAVASAVAGDVIINGAEAVNKSYPGFWDDFKALGGRVEQI